MIGPLRGTMGSATREFLEELKNAGFSVGDNYNSHPPHPEQYINPQRFVTESQMA